MKWYFSLLAHHYLTGNSLEQQVLDYLISLDRNITNSESVETYKEEIVTHIQKLEKENQPCKPVGAYFDGNVSAGFGYSLKSHYQADFELHFKRGNICVFRLHLSQ